MTTPRNPARVTFDVKPVECSAVGEWVGKRAGWTIANGSVLAEARLPEPLHSAADSEILVVVVRKSWHAWIAEHGAEPDPADERWQDVIRGSWAASNRARKVRWLVPIAEGRIRGVYAVTGWGFTIAERHVALRIAPSHVVADGPGEFHAVTAYGARYDADTRLLKVPFDDRDHEWPIAKGALLDTERGRFEGVLDDGRTIVVVSLDPQARTGRPSPASS